MPRIRQSNVMFAALVIAATSIGATGCSVFTTASCASWVDYSSTTQMEHDADAVVTTSSVSPAGTEKRFGVRAAAYDVEVATVEKGDVHARTAIRVVSTPDACGANGYYDGDDQMETAGPVRLYLFADGDDWATLTPFDGVVSLGG